MPNLVGIWDPQSSEEPIWQKLAKQLQRVRIPEVRYAEYVSIHPGFGMGLLDHGILENGPQPAQTPDGRVCLLLDGELYNARELKRRYQKELPDEVLSTPELCLRLILLYGEEVVREFNGLFCLVLYDRDARRVTLISDRYGFRPLFYVRRQKALVFGSELKALVAVDPETRRVDELGTLEFFFYGSHIIEKTSIQGYSRLGPAAILTVDEQGLRARRYWAYKYDEDAPTLNQATYFTEFSVLFDRAVERCMQGSHRIGIFLSGGYDSRAVSAAIRKHHLPIPAFTFGQPESRDVRYAAMLAERLGLAHYPLTDRGPYLYPHCRAIVWRTEGMLSFVNTTSIRYHPVLKKKVDIILTGFLAEFGGSHTWPQLLLARSRRAAIQAIFDRFQRHRVDLVRRVFNASFLKPHFELLRDRFEQSFESVLNDHPLNVPDCWNLIHLQPRSTYHSPSIDRYRFETRAPHMDAELVDFLLRIPPYARLEQRVYKQMIAYAFPQIRDIPCTNSGRPINPSFAREYAAMVASFLGRKAAAPLQELLHRRQPLDREFRDLGEDFRAEPQLVRDILRPLLRSDIFPSEMFNLSEIEAIINEHYEKNGRHEATLSGLISWGLGMKYFLREDLSDVPAEMYAP